MSFGGKKGNQPEPTWRQFVFGGLSGMIASCFTHPIDLVKVRLQIRDAKGGSDGMVRTGIKILQEEGLSRGIYKGLSASLLRQGTYTTARFGFYLQIKEFLSKGVDGPLPLWKKTLASMLGGAAGAFVGSPADIVLVRMQADGKLPKEQQRGYKNAFEGLSRMAREEGIGSWWKGSGPNIIRAMLMTTGQLASYDQTKQFLLQTSFFTDNALTHFVASTIAAFIATVMCNPADVIKTRVMNSKKGDTGSMVYKNSIDCAIKMLKNEGPMAFYKGFTPFFIRLGPHTIITFIAYEQLVKVADYFVRK